MAENTQNQQNQQPTLTINAQYIKDLSFELPDAIKSFQESSEQPSIDVNVNVSMTKLGDLTHEVVLQTKIKATRKDTTLFVLELSYGGLFTIGSGVAADATNPILLIECPRLLFPFARAIISNTSREAGFPALTLNPIDFLELYKRQMAEQNKGTENNSMTDADGKRNKK